MMDRRIVGWMGVLGAWGVMTGAVPVVVPQGQGSLKVQTKAISQPVVQQIQEPDTPPLQSLPLVPPKEGVIVPGKVGEPLQPLDPVPPLPKEDSQDALFQKAPGGSLQVPGLAFVPVVMAVLPAEVEAGKTVQLQISGSHLPAGMSIAVGPGITLAGPVQQLGDSLARVLVKVDAGAVPGIRPLQLLYAGKVMNTGVSLSVKAARVRMPSGGLTGLRAPEADAVDASDKAKENVAVRVSPGIRPMVQRRADPLVLPPMVPVAPPEPVKIDLDTPKWYSKSSDNSQKNVLVPFIDDALLFSWKEPNAGLSEWFEFRIRDRQGKVLLTQEIRSLEISFHGKKTRLPPATTFRPDSVFLDKLLDPAGMISGVKISAVPYQGGPFAGMPSEAELFWDVVGHRSYPKSGVDAAKSGRGRLQVRPLQGEQVGALDASLMHQAAPSRMDVEAPQLKAGIEGGQPVGRKVLSGKTIAVTEQAGGALQVRKVVQAGAKPAPADQEVKFTPRPLGGVKQDGAMSGSMELKEVEPVGRSGLSFAGAESVVAEEMVDVVVARSEAWPLRRPGRPNGLGVCPLDGPQTGLRVENMSQAKSGGSQTVKSAVHHPGDEFILTGQLNLGMSPFSVTPQENNYPKKPGDTTIGYKSAQHVFDNVFVDWGDGAVVHPLTVSSAGSTSQVGGGAYQRGETMPLTGADTYQQYESGTWQGDPAFPPQALVHAYAEPATYKVRVYVLSDADAQKVNPETLAESYEQGGAQQHSSASVGERAYTVFCTQVTVEPFKDPVANGPLQLLGLEITGFGEAADKKELSSAAKKGLANVSGSRKASQAGVKLSIPSGQSVKRVQVNPVVSGEKADVLTLTPAVDGVKVSGLGESIDASCSACNKSWMARASLSYIGSGVASGDLQVVWKVRAKGSKAVISLPDPNPGIVPASPSRTGNPANWNDPEPAVYRLVSPRLPVDPADVFEVWVEASVREPTLADTLERVLAGGGLDAKAVKRMSDLTAQGIRKGAPAEKVGILRPTRLGGMSASVYQAVSANTLGQLAGRVSQSSGKVSISSLAFANGGLQGKGVVPTQSGESPLKTGLTPDGIGSQVDDALMLNVVGSSHKHYRVVAADPAKPCVLWFTDKQGGRFELYVDQANPLKESSPGIYSGKVGLNIPLVTTPHSKADVVVPVQVSGWKISDDGRVANGAKIETSVASDELHPRGMIATVSKVSATTGESVQASLNVKISDSLLHLPGSNDSPLIKLSGPLSAEGNFLGKATLASPLSLGWSGFALEAPNAVFDLSQKEGAAPAACAEGNTGVGWTGVWFGSDAKIKLNTSDLVTVKVPAPNWGVTGRTCGELLVEHSPQLKQLAIGKGWVTFDRIKLNARNSGGFEAHYRMDVKLPWPDAMLHSDDVAMIETSQTEGTFDFASVRPAQNVEKDYGPIHLRIPRDSFRFGVDSAGWRAIADPAWSFKAEGKPFVPGEILVPDTYFGMEGRAYFSGNAQPLRSIPLNAIAALGKTRYEVQSVTFNGGSGGADPMRIAFSGVVKLSDALPASPVEVNYVVKAGSYEGKGPNTSPFKVKMAFPAGQPSVDSDIQPVYAPQGGETRFEGELDIGMFGGPPVSGAFLLGYSQGTDYWLAKAQVPLGSTGIPLYPPYLSLFALRGGMGYNISLDSFQKPLSEVQPSPGAGALFFAGLRLGAPNAFNYMMDGDLTINGSNGGGRIDFKAWLLTTDFSGKAPLNGYLQYASKQFDGRMWGRLSLVGDAVYFDLGSGPNNAALDMHVGDGWHIYAGKKEGPRLRAHMLVADADSYLMLGDQVGFATGGSLNLYLGAGSSSVASAYVKGWMDMGLQITPKPQVIGDFGAGAEAGVCVAGACESAGVTAQIHAEAPPVNVNAHATVEFPWPLPDVSFDVHL